ncbi:MAG: hypothetical protein Q8L13_24720 [Bradyrhizobium sp.]|uniref:hypothetical protein n=1 Tax=Bradyrhizobium sp. TaxID=376 RepID=UPI002731193C|nr:hypothetical protein [Bradyrhizobium sp.]MDP1869531.1 hypothetical protein [Bradyrhizobium sp.]
MSEAALILPNMRGGCATVGNTVHTLFRVSGRRPRPMARPDDGPAIVETRHRDGGTDAATG